MRKIIQLLILLSFSTVRAQEERIITITSIGQGKTKEEAKEVAIEKAISLTHQTFISSKKEILNNKAVNDEIILNTNDQIQKTDVVSEIQLPNNEYVTTLNIKISITKLTSFFESKGEIVEFKGGVLSQNIKLQKLKEDSENSIIKNLCLSSFEILKNSVDFTIKYSQPKVIGDRKDYCDKPLTDYKFSVNNGYYLKEFKPEDFIIQFTIDTKHNDNYFAFLNFFKKNIESLTMNTQEIEEYKNLGKEVYVLKIDDVFYYLRKKDNLENLYNLIIKTNILPLSFKISSNASEIIPLLKNRFLSPSEYHFPTRLYEDYNGVDDKYNFNSLINATIIDYDSYYFKTTRKDLLKNTSSIIFKNSNIYPFYKDFFKTIYVEDNSTRNDSKINDENTKKEPNNYLFIDTKEIHENSYSFSELFTLDEIEKINNFQVTSFNIEDLLKNEEEKLKNVNLIKLAGGFGYHDDFYGRKYNYGELVPYNTIARLIEVQKNRVLVKIYKSTCCFTKNCYNNPGGLYYIPIDKVLGYLKSSDVKNEKGEISYQFN